MSDKTALPNDTHKDLPLLNLIMSVQDIPATGLKRDYAPDADELKTLSALIGLGELENLRFGVEITPLSRNEFLMVSRLTAQIRQTCSITLEPLLNELADETTTRFVPLPRFEELAAEEEEGQLEDENLEPLSEGRLAVGQVLYDQLEASIDPYPRTEGADWEEISRDAKLSDEGTESPFAVLASRKKNDGN